MALVPGWAAVLCIVPPSDEVALGETVRRALSASSTPRMVFGGGDTRRRLARKAPRGTRVVWGLVLASLAASLLRRLMWQNHLNYPGSSAQAITIKATPAQTHFKRNNPWSVG